MCYDVNVYIRSRRVGGGGARQIQYCQLFAELFVANMCLPNFCVNLVCHTYNPISWPSPSIILCTACDQNLRLFI